MKINIRSPYPGVRLIESGKKWRVDVHRQGKHIYLGRYEYLLEAIKVRMIAEKKYPKIQAIHSPPKTTLDPYKLIDDIGFERNLGAMVRYAYLKNKPFGNVSTFNPPTKIETDEAFNFPEEDNLLLEDIRRQVKLQYENEKVM